MELHPTASRQESSGCCARTPTDLIIELVGIIRLQKLDIKDDLDIDCFLFANTV
jgi:hypothetical protein